MVPELACRNCQTVVEDEDKFCPNCGHALKAPEIEADELFNLNQDTAPPTPKSEEPPWAEKTQAQIKAEQQMQGDAVDERKVFNEDDDPTEETQEQTSLEQKNIDQTTLSNARKRLKAQKKRKIRFSGWIFAILRSCLALAILVFPATAVFVGYSDSNQFLMLLGSGLVLFPPLLWLALLRHQTGSHAFLSSACFSASLSWLFLSKHQPALQFLDFTGKQVWEAGVFLFFVVLVQWALQTLIETRLFWFFRLLLVLGLSACWLDFLRIVAMNQDLKSLSSPDHPLAVLLVPWLDQAAWYLSPAWLLIHIFFPTFILIFSLSVLARLKDRDREEALARLFLCFAMGFGAFLLVPVFGEFRYSLIRIPIESWLNLPLPPLG